MKKTTKQGHSYVPFYMTEWMAGTSHMPRPVWSVYFQICLYTWDKVKPVPTGRLTLMLADLGPQGSAIVDALVEDGTLTRNEDGSVHSPRALDEARKAFDLWKRKSGGGKTARGVMQDSSTDQDQDQEQEQDSKELLPSAIVGGEGPPTPETPEISVSVIEMANDIHGITTTWNAMAASAGLAQVKVLTDKRRKALKARIGDHSAEEIVAAILKIPDNPFLMGENQRAWKANFDWLVQPQSCAKLIEGGYEQGQGTRSAWH